MSGHRAPVTVCRDQVPALQLERKPVRVTRREHRGAAPECSSSLELDRKPIGDRGGVPLVPFSDSIEIQAVVSNVGNEEESDIPVELVILDVDGGATIEESRIVESLVAGASTTVRFADLAVEPGGLYEVRLTATIPLDNDPDNDSWTLTFIWNEES